jgi:DNA-binding MarR family transcriptional regulator
MLTQEMHTVANDTSLNLAAKGLFLMIITMPDDQPFTIKEFSRRTPHGVMAISRAIEALEARGYIKRKTLHRDGRTLGSSVTIFCANGMHVTKGV